MYIAIFDIEEMSDVNALHSYLNDLGYDVIRKKHNVLVSSYNEKTAINVLKQGNVFLDQREAIFDSWKFEKDNEIESKLENPYYQCDVLEKDFY